MNDSDTLVLKCYRHYVTNKWRYNKTSMYSFAHLTKLYIYVYTLKALFLVPVILMPIGSGSNLNKSLFMLLALTTKVNKLYL